MAARTRRIRSLTIPCAARRLRHQTFLEEQRRFLLHRRLLLTSGQFQASRAIRCSATSSTSAAFTKKQKCQKISFLPKRTRSSSELFVSTTSSRFGKKRKRSRKRKKRERNQKEEEAVEPAAINIQQSSNIEVRDLLLHRIPIHFHHHQKQMWYYLIKLNKNKIM